MPVVDFGEKLSTGTRDIVRLKETGSSIQFRLLGAAVAEGNHFFQTDNGWEVIPCQRINKGEYCEHCAKIYHLIDEIPAEIKADKEEFNKERNRIKNANRPLVVSISYNFPVIDRFNNGLATSIKSLDLGAKSYQNLTTLPRTVEEYVNKLAN